MHVSNFFTTDRAGRARRAAARGGGAPAGSAVFFANSGTEAVEAAVKLARRTGRTRIVAAEGAFHGRTTGALALTHKPSYREPFEPLLPGVVHVPYGDEAALRAAVTDEVAALVLEPIQGEAGVIAADPAYLRLARELTTAAGALLVLDEVQTGIGRTGSWFAFQQAGIVPDAMTLAKGLGGGVPIGALVTFGPDGVRPARPPASTARPSAATRSPAPPASPSSTPSPRTGCSSTPRRWASGSPSGVLALGHPLVAGVRGRGLHRAIVLTADISAAVADRAHRAGFIVNPVQPDALRLTPPLVITAAQVDDFVAALPALLDGPEPS